MAQTVPKGQPPGPRFLALAPLAIWVALAGLFGGVLGLGGFTLSYAQGLSYLSNDPRACANCHVMRDYYDGWQKSSHHAAAVCNDCHTPHDLAGKYTTKAVNGFFHSFAFTRGRFPDAIRITARNSRVTEGTCLSCHAELTSSITAGTHSADAACLRCHFNVGHSAAYAPVARGDAAVEEKTYGNE